MIDLIDTHCHLNFQRYDEDRDAVIKNAAAAGVKRIIDYHHCYDILATIVILTDINQ